MVRSVVIIALFVIVFTINAAAFDEWISFTGSGISMPAETWVAQQDAYGVSVEMTLDGMNVQEREEQGRIFHFLSVPQANWTNETGRPKLPVIRTLLMIPSRSDVSIEIEGEESTILSGYNVYPVGEEVIKYRGEAVYIGEEFAIDESFYSKDTFYPQELASISFSGYLRDQRLVQLEFHPIR